MASLLAVKTESLVHLAFSTSTCVTLRPPQSIRCTRRLSHYRVLWPSLSKESQTIRGGLRPECVLQTRNSAVGSTSIAAVLTEVMYVSVTTGVAMAPGTTSEPFHVMDFNSRRSPVLGRRGMVASSQPLASEVRLSSVSSFRWGSHITELLTGLASLLSWHALMQAGMRILQQGGNAAGRAHLTFAHTVKIACRDFQECQWRWNAGTCLEPSSGV